MSIVERIKKHPKISAAGFMLTLIIGYATLSGAFREIGGQAHNFYHDRSAENALIQFAPDPSPNASAADADDAALAGDGAASEIRPLPQTYTAAFENRSDEILVVTHVIFDLSEISNMAAATDGNVSSDGGPVNTVTTYELKMPSCRASGRQPLIPPFRIEPGRVATFRVNLSDKLPDESAVTCSLGVRFQTNQGMTNYSVDGEIWPNFPGQEG